MCGVDVANILRYSVCTKAYDQAACSAGGGAWVTGQQPGGGRCVCATNQEKCPCTKRADCLGPCIADMDLLSEPGKVHCPAIGHCSAISEVPEGCVCLFDWEGLHHVYCQE
jgi:hypothetical protein